MTEVITVLKEEAKFLKALDVSYSYNLAKKMEKPGTNPVLGFRTAGSGAEFEVGGDAGPGNAGHRPFRCC